MQDDQMKQPKAPWPESVDTDLLRTVFEQAGEGIFVSDATGRYIEVNQRGCDMLGYSRAEILRLSPSDLIPAEDLAVTPIRMAEMRAGKIVLQERRLRCKDGRLLPVEVSARALPDGRLLAFFRDITERKQVEAALKRSEDRFIKAFGAGPVAMTITRLADGQFVDVNDSFLELSGYRREEVIGRTVFELGLYPDPDQRAKLMGRMRERGAVYNYEMTVVAKSGEPREVMISNETVELNGEPHILAITVDITSRKQMEVALRESESRFRDTFEQVAVGIAHLNLDGRWLWVNQRLCQIVGYSREELLARTFQDITHPLDLEMDLAYQDQILTGQIETYTMEKRYLDRTRAVIWVDLTVSLRRDEMGRPLYFIAVVQDISSRKQSQAQLLYQASLLQNVSDAIIATDLDFKITSWNRAAERLYGWPAGEVIGRTLRQVLQTEYPPGIQPEQVTQQLLTQGRWEGEITQKRKDGTVIYIRTSISLILDSLGPASGVVSVNHDITAQAEAKMAQAQLEEQLRQSQKMEGIGRLAGGVAHDFNNLLTVIQGYAELLQTRTTLDSIQHHSVSQIAAAAQSATALTRQLLTFSRKQILAPTILDLNDLVDNLRKMLERLIGEDILLETHLTPNLHPVQVDPGQMEQVLMNLVANARDAMPTGGNLTIKTVNVELGQRYTKTHFEGPLGSAVMLAVTDTGQGMDAKTEAQIFEPFFTTKAIGKGTGLGLATVYGIVKQNGGHIIVSSEPEQGTTFKIYLPAAKMPAGPLPQVQTQRETPGGDETILLVEDEAAVRDLVLTLLREKGYTMLEAQQGQAALALARQHRGPIHLLLTDVVMPGMSGRELAEQLGQFRPETKVLYMSGYTDDAVMRHGILTAQVEFLAKPFSPAGLAAKVRAVLD